MRDSQQAKRSVWSAFILTLGEVMYAIGGCKVQKT